MSREKLILKLVTTDHLNVPERAQLDPPSVSRSEIIRAIEQVLETGRFFPPDATPVRENQRIVEPLYEGGIIEEAGDSYRVHWQQAGPHPLSLRGHSEKSFPSLEDAVNHFIDNEYKGTIDGIPIAG